MKPQGCSIIIIAACASLITGCANQSSNSASNASTANPSERSHSQEELKKTGRTETGAALQQVEPGVQTRGN